MAPPPFLLPPHGPKGRGEGGERGVGPFRPTFRAFNCVTYKRYAGRALPPDFERAGGVTSRDQESRLFAAECCETGSAPPRLLSFGISDIIIYADQWNECRDATLAQPEEHPPRKRGVAGSNPAGGSPYDGILHLRGPLSHRTRRALLPVLEPLFSPVWELPGFGFQREGGCFWPADGGS